MHWVTAILRWHYANVLGNFVATIEMGIILILVGRPILRRLIRCTRAHLQHQIGLQMRPLHREFDQLWSHLLNIDTNDLDGDGKPDQPPEPKE